MARVKEATRSHERRHHRRRRRSSSSDSEAEESVFPPWKTLGVVAVIGVCFAILYPKMFHPMIMFALGYGSKEDGIEERHQPPIRGRPMQNMPPGVGRPGAPLAHGGSGGQSGGSTGSKGMWHTVLPFYTVAVIGFLLYTLSKIMWKKPSKKKKRSTRYSRVEITDSSASESEDNRPGHRSKKELKTLQGRLLQTEDAMQKILSQLELLQNGGVDDETAQKIRSETMETLNGLSKDETISNEGKDEYNEKQQEDTESEMSGSEQQSQPYINDLEKALSDFKILTENYVAASMALKQKQQQEVDKTKEEASEHEKDQGDVQTENNDNEEENKDIKKEEQEELVGFDVMESENDLTILESTGTVVGGNCHTDDCIAGNSPIDEPIQSNECASENLPLACERSDKVRKRQKKAK